MILLTSDRLAIVAALRKTAKDFAELGAKPYGRKAYRDGLKERAQRLEQLAERFSHFTLVTLECS